MSGPRPRLIVVSGPAGSPKLPTLWRIAAPDANMLLLHPDQIRVAFGRTVTEPDLLKLLATMALSLLDSGYSVATAGSAGSRKIWEDTARTGKADMEWIELGGET